MNNKDIIRLVDCAKYRKAERFLAALLQEKPYDFFYLSVMGETLFCQGKYKEALSCLEKSEKSNPDFPVTVYYKGRTLLCLDRFAEAQECFDRFISIDGKDAVDPNHGITRRTLESLQNDALFVKSRCYWCQYCIEEAETWARRHLEGRRKGLKSEYSKRYVQNFLRELKYTRRNPDDRYKDFNEGVAPRAAEKRISNHIDKLSEQGDVHKLIKYLKRKTREFPNDYYLWTIMSEYCYDNDMKEFCMESAEKAHAIKYEEDDMLVVYDYGNALYLNGRYDEAIAEFDKILAKDINYIAYGEHGEGMRWAKRLVADAKEQRDCCIERRTTTTEKEQ